MNRIIFSLMMAALFTAGITAEAKASLIALGSTDEFTIYRNGNAVRTSDNISKIWTIWSYKKIQGSPGYKYYSEQYLEEYNCTSDEFRVMAIILYNGKMGNGKVVLQNTDPKVWKPVPPDSISSVVMSEACK